MLDNWYLVMQNCLSLGYMLRVLLAVSANFPDNPRTRPCMINHIWGLKQLWLQVNGHAWFHLQRLRWPVRNGEGAKNSKWKYMSPAGFEPTPASPRQESCSAIDRSATLVRYEVEHYSLTVFWNGYVTIPVWNRLWFDTQCKVL